MKVECLIVPRGSALRHVFPATIINAEQGIVEIPPPARAMLYDANGGTVRFRIQHDDKRIFLTPVREFEAGAIKKGAK